VSLIPIKYF